MTEQAIAHFLDWVGAGFHPRPDHSERTIHVDAMRCRRFADKNVCATIGGRLPYQASIYSAPVGAGPGEQ